MCNIGTEQYATIYNYINILKYTILHAWCTINRYSWYVYTTLETLDLKVIYAYDQHNNNITTQPVLYPSLSLLYELQLTRVILTDH